MNTLNSLSNKSGAKQTLHTPDMRKGPTCFWKSARKDRSRICESYPSSTVMGNTSTYG
jgi:hypothetical protein